MILLLFYGAFSAVFIGLMITVYIKMQRFGLIKALGASLLVGCLLFLFFPMPIHGGFTFLFEIAIDEVKHEMQDRALAQQEKINSAFLTKFENRFSGVLSFQKLSRESKRWYEVTSVEGTRGWHDTRSAMVWSEPFTGVGSGNRPTLDEAVSFCRHLPPAGFWALPTEAERYHFWKSGGPELFDERRYGSISGLVDSRLQMVIPVVQLGRGADLAVRCIARGPNAPVRGYIQDDIPLAEWNRYQMSKVAQSPNQVNRPIDKPWQGNANERQ